MRRTFENFGILNLILALGTAVAGAAQAWADPTGTTGPTGVIRIFPTSEEIARWYWSGLLDGSSSSASAGSSSSASAPRPTASPEPSRLTHPYWEEDTLGNVNYSYRHDQRRNLSHRGGPNEFETYRINERGRIDGEEFLALSRPAEQALFEQVMRQRGRTEDLPQLYQEYLQQITDQTLAQLILNRIMDHEAMKHKIAPLVSENRVNYVMRAAMTQNAVNRDKVPTRTVSEQVRDERTGAVLLDERGRPRTRDVKELASHEIYSNQLMYGWLKETVGANPVRFNISWRERGLRLFLEQDVLNDRGELAWEPVALSFDRLPDTWQEWERQIEEKLQAPYRVLIRRTIWRALVTERYPDITWRSLFSVTTTELDNMYAAMRESTFRIQAMSAPVIDIVASGPKAVDFKTRFATALREREQALMTEIFGANPLGARSPDEQDALRRRIVELRNTVPREVYGQVSAQFAGDIAAGNLRVRIEDRSLQNNGIDQPQSDSSVASQQLRFAFNPYLVNMALFPKLEAIDADQSIKIMIVREIVPGEVTYLDMRDERVERVLRAKIMEKTQGRFFRDLAFQLFRENRFEWRNQTCRELIWPCGNVTPRNLAEKLFPEVLYPGRTLRLEGTSQQITSSLERTELLGRVFSIETMLFSRVFEVPNDHVDPEARFHNL